ncbi:RHS repeat-associated core domain-containing protein [Streptomyces manipurensis]|uniref:RHS repeat-associated core domain-containing protein n=1 Tax=Streptomyces manipurensis TaxID=1077945 RepID=UPI003C6F41C8
MAASVLVGVLPGTATAAGSDRGPALPELKQPTAVPVSKAAVGGSKRPDAAATPKGKKAKTAWPKAGTADVHLGNGSGQAGKLPVKITQAPKLSRATAGSVPATVAAPDGTIKVSVADRDVTRRAGIDGVLLSLHRTEGSGGTGSARVEVGYDSYRDAYGGDWAARLRLVELPACVLTEPELPECRTQKPLATKNDTKTATLAAATTLAAAPQVLAAVADDAGPTGNYKATSLQASGSWSAGASTGGFSWTYPIAVPGVPGGAAPQIALAYDSQSVDGRTAASNAQASWIGDGWNWEPGFVERKYKGCEDDKAGGTNTTKVGDLCWFNDNATLSLNGKTTELVFEAGKGWHPQGDGAEKVEKLSGAVNGDDNGEHWKVTGTDGTQYFFGLNRLPGWKDNGVAADDPVTNSAWTVPVFGNHQGEPCYNATFANASCKQAWRWQLDYAVDARGNAMVYHWKTETNNYTRNVSETTGKGTVTQYIRGGWLDRIDYGLRSDALFTGKPMGQVLFGVDERCLANCGTFDEANAKNWPDAPFDQFCKDGSTECKDKHSPTFWSRMRLKSINTRVLTAGAYKEADTWTLDQSFPPSGDGVSTPMWLKSVQHTGKAGGTKALPPVSFAGEQKANRVDKTGDGLAPFIRLRLSQITTETGGTIGITYSPQDCSPTTLPKPDATNTTRCYPVKWAYEGSTAQLDWFNKYVVTQVVEGDNLAATPDKVTSYSYLDGAAWAKSEDEFTKPEDRVHSVARGYGRVQTRTGAGNDARTLTENRYFRGLDGTDVKDSTGTSVTDRPEFAGALRESVTFDGDDTTKPVTATSSTPWRSTAIATRNRPGLPALVSYRTGTEKESTRTTVTGGIRTTEVARTFDAYGMVSAESATGDKDKTGDEQCTTTSYARNTTTHILTTVSRVEIVAVPCGAPVSRPADVIDDVRNYYDNGALDTVSGAGLLTRTERINGKGDGYETQSSTPSICGPGKDQPCFDIYGRALAVADPFGRATATVFTPATGEVPTSSKVTNPLGHVTTTVLDPVRNLPTQVTDANNKVTTTGYDALGRVTKVWLPTRRAATYPDSPNYVFDYLVRNDGPVVTTTKILTHDSKYREAYAFQDGLLRDIQRQEPSPDGAGRLITEALYDTRGFAWRNSGRYYATGAAAPVLVTGQELQYPASSDTVFDGTGRVTAVVSKRFGVETGRTTTSYTGDTTTVVPPKGGTATTKVVDANGRATALLSYTAADRTTSAATQYSYDKLGRLSEVRDAAGAKWTYGYDARGRAVQVNDPDKGTSHYAFDAANRTTDVTDGRNITLHTDFDALGRQTAVRKGTTTLAEWVYDTVAKGQPSKSVRWVNGKAYEFATTGYNSLYLPVVQQVTIPDSEGALAGTYQWINAYNANTGQVMSVQHPAAGGLPQEDVSNTYLETSGLLDTVTAGADPLVSANTYDRYGRNVRQELGAFAQHVWVSNEFDEHTGRLTRRYTDREAAPQRIDDSTYSYDSFGNVTGIATSFGQDSGKTTDTQCFTLDQLRRITEAWSNTGTACAASPSAAAVGGQDAYWTSYTYDAVGNRKSETEHKTPAGPAADTVRTYAAPTAGKHDLPKVTQTGATPGEDLFTYDAVGNTKTRKIGSAAQQTLNWDDEGHLASTSQDAKTTSYLYDAQGERLLRKDSGGTTLYLPGGNELKLNKSGTTVTGTRYYSVAGQTIAVRTGDKLTFVLGDHHGTGTTQVSADAAQAVVRRKTGIFGKERGGQAAGWVGDKGFVGGTKEPDTGLIHLGAREYDQATGRFLSVDPIMDLADPQQTHGYSYANNNPASLSDPSGLKPIECIEGYSCKFNGKGWEVGEPKGHNNAPAPKSKTYASQDAQERLRSTDRSRAKKQREKRFSQIFDDKKFSIGEYIDEIDDANKLACRMTPGPEKVGCNYNRYANLYGVKLFGLEYKGLAGMVRDALSRIDESAISLKKDSEFGFTESEFETAFILAMEGRNVVARSDDTGAPGSLGDRKSFDAWVDGVRTEFKTQPSTKPKTIVREIFDSADQGADAAIITLPNGNEKLVNTVLADISKREFTTKTTLGLQSVRIIGPGFDVTKHFS